MKLLITALLLTFCQVSMAQVYYSGKTKCVAKNVAGDSVAEAITNCSKFERRTRGDCAKSVSCMPYQTHCSSKNYAGDNVKTAVANCMEFSNYDERNCLRSVSCR